MNQRSKKLADKWAGPQLGGLYQTLKRLYVFIPRAMALLNVKNPLPMARTSAALLVLFTLLSCTPIERQSLEVPLPERFVNSPRAETQRLKMTQWWRQFGDERLNQLVEEAIRNNHDIKAATERVLQARASLGISHALRFPTLSLNLSTSRQRQTTMGITSHTNTFNINLVASYEADLWGKLSSGQKQAMAALGSMEQLRRQILHSVVSDVVNLYFHAIALKQMLRIRNEYIANARENLEAIRGRFNLGRATYLDVLQAETTLNEAFSQVEPLRRQLKETLYRLSVLTGGYPAEPALADAPVESYLKGLGAVPSGLPSELLRTRPDIMASALKAEEAFQALKVARAKRFPVISLTATGGYASSELRDLFKPESLFWQLSAGILQPLFEAGRLRAQEEVARAAYREAIINYARTVLQAFYEVERALSDRQSLLNERAELLKLVKNLDRTYQSALDRYRLGLVDLTTVLGIQRQLYTARLRLLQTDEAVLSNRVFLYRALGGKWTDEEFIEKGANHEG